MDTNWDLRDVRAVVTQPVIELIQVPVAGVRILDDRVLKRAKFGMPHAAFLAGQGTKKTRERAASFSHLQFQFLCRMACPE